MKCVCIITLFIRHENPIFSVPYFIVICGLSGSTIFFCVVSHKVQFSEQIYWTCNAIIRADRRLTIREVAEDAGIAIGTCQKILTEDLQMRRVSAKFVPRLLKAEQKDDHMSVYTDFRKRVQNDPNFMSSVITGDERWVYGYDPETNKCPPSVKLHHLLDRRKRSRWIPMSRTCWFRSSTLTGSFIMSTSLEARR